MAMQFYASPEQVQRDRSEYARKGIARGRSAVVLTYSGGVLFVAENLTSLSIPFETDKKFLPNLETLWTPSRLGPTLQRAGISFLEPTQLLGTVPAAAGAITGGTQQPDPVVPLHRAHGRPAVPGQLTGSPVVTHPTREARDVTSPASPTTCGWPDPHAGL